MIICRCSVCSCSVDNRAGVGRGADLEGTDGVEVVTELFKEAVGDWFEEIARTLDEDD